VTVAARPLPAGAAPAEAPASGVAGRRLPGTSLATLIYDRLKDDILEFRLFPGQRFTEPELCLRTGTSRTTVRAALHRLMQEGHVEILPREGWAVAAIDFERLEHLYDLRMTLELAAVRRLCDVGTPDTLDALVATWSAPPTGLDPDAMTAHVAELDEGFHRALVSLAGNPESARVHSDVTDRIRIVRRLDFTQAARIEATYAEHASILAAIVRREPDRAASRLRAHIEVSMTEVRKITVHRLQQARRGVLRPDERFAHDHGATSR
jgi:DNA-binding GntR family transcriptional regulator